MNKDCDKTMSEVNGGRFVVDLGGTRVRSGYVSADGEVLATSFRSEKIAPTVSTRRDLCDLLVEKMMGPVAGQEKFVVSVAGPVSPDHRVVRRYTNVLCGDANIPLAEMIEQAVHQRTGKAVQVFVIKDAVAATMAEMGPRGSASDRSEVIAIILGTGTGGAPCRRGAGNEVVLLDSLADLGHYQVDVQSTEPCNCGSRGCVERQTSGVAVARSANRRASEAELYGRSCLHAILGRKPGEITGEDIAWAAARKDEFTVEVLRGAARPLAVLLRCIFTSHPDITVVFVGGFALGVGEVLLDLVRVELMETGVPFIDRRNLESFLQTAILLGSVPPEETNLVGARLFLLQEEKCKEHPCLPGQ